MLRLAHLTLTVCLFLVLPGSGTLAQCILANPSFEVGGTGGAVFGGWNQFGDVGSTPVASHGQLGARTRGPATGSWGVSAFWQSLDTEPGERWQITGHVLHPGANPLVGQNIALINVEWRDAAGALITYDSFTAADAGSPTDLYLDFAFLSNAAPAGTVQARLLVGVLQSPDDPVSEVFFDQVTFSSTTFPTIDDLQWSDFPGGRTLDFSGRQWRVKGPGFYGPGSNVFSDSPDCVWVDDQGQLHLTLSFDDGTWTSTEVTTEEALGYGDYILTTRGPLHQLDPQAVLGIFLWEYGPCYDYAYTWWNAYNEIDIEYSRWENPANDLAQFVAQPFDWPGNLSRFDATFGAEEIVSHAMRWLPNRVEYRVWRGGPEEEATSVPVHSWTYAGAHIPRPEQPRLHLNLWRIAGAPASTQEVVFTDFRFVPQNGASPVDPGEDILALGAAPAGRLHPAAPNPFNPRTTLSFTLGRPGTIELEIFDLNGRLVRTLLHGQLAAGRHSAVWDGRDGRGRRVASGIYLSVLRGEDFLESGRLVLLK